MCLNMRTCANNTNNGDIRFREVFNTQAELWENNSQIKQNFY